MCSRSVVGCPRVQTSNEPLAEAALKTLEKYVSWIDIGLVANDTFVPLLCELLGNETLRIPALACFYEMVAKGMTRMEKVSLIGRLRLVDLLCALRVDAGVDPEFLADVAELVSLVGVELVGAWQNCVEGAGEGAMPALVAPMLSSLAQRAFVLLVHPEVSVGKEVVTFAHAMVICIKKELAATEVPPSVVAASFSVRSFTKQLIECLASRMRYPTEALSKNDEAEFAEARRSVKSEFMNLTRACRNEIMEFFGAHIAPKVRANAPCDAVAPQRRRPYTQCPPPQVAMLASLAWQDCELAMHMLYHFAEAVPTTVMNEAMKAGPLCDMVVAIHKSGVGLHKHRLVVLAYMDLTVRYAGVLHAHPELLLPVLQGMMGAGYVGVEVGVWVVSCLVSCTPQASRCRGCFFACCTTVASSTRSHRRGSCLRTTSSVLSARSPGPRPWPRRLWTPSLAACASFWWFPTPMHPQWRARCPQRTRATCMRRLACSSRRHGCHQSERQRTLCAVGSASPRGYGGDTCVCVCVWVFDAARLLQAALSPLIDQMNLGLSHAASGSMTAENATAMGDWMTRVLSVIGPVVKAFVTPVPDNVAAVIHVVLEVAVKAGQAVPHHEKLRQKVMFLLHVGIICLGDRLLPVLGPVIVGLVNTMGVPAVPDVGRLLHQLVAKFKVRGLLLSTSNTVATPHQPRSVALHCRPRRYPSSMSRTCLSCRGCSVYVCVCGLCRVLLRVTHALRLCVATPADAGA